MVWVSPTPLVAGVPQSQLPYFIGNKTLVYAPGSGYKNGHCLGFPPILCPPVTLGGGSNTYRIPALPLNLTKIRVPFGLTGIAPPGNLIIQVWHSNWDYGTTYPLLSQDFGALTPDATATIPLSSLPAANIADNYQCSVASLPYTEATFDHPVVFSDPAPPLLGDPTKQEWIPMIAMYLDNAFANVSNVVFSSPQNDGVLTVTYDSLDFTGATSTFLYDLPYQDHSGTCLRTAGSEIRRGIYPDLFFGPVTQGRAYAHIIDA